MDATVLLVMDVQRGIVDRFAGDPGYLERLAGAIAAARGAGVPVVYVTIGFRPGYPEISARNRTFSALAAAGRFVEGARPGWSGSARRQRVPTASVWQAWPKAVAEP